MLYTRKELTKEGLIDKHIAVQRYLNKFINHRKEINRLKWHEKDFFYEHLMILRNNAGELGFNIYSIPEAKNYVLYRLILIYAANNNTINFNKKAFEYNGEIPQKEKKQHKQIFWKLLDDWTTELDEGKNQYLMVIKPLYKDKLKELESLKKQKKIDHRTFTIRHIYIRATFYHIYYLTRLYFDEMNIKTEFCTICGINFYADIYTYAHILSRHYYPEMNKRIGGSLNDNIPQLEIRELPTSILNLIKQYAKKKHITQDTEYLLFIIDTKKYILWIKYGPIALLSNQIGMEIRSFYHCEKDYDLEKFNNKTVVKIDDNLSIAI